MNCKWSDVADVVNLRSLKLTRCTPWMVTGGFYKPYSAQEVCDYIQQRHPLSPQASPVWKKLADAFKLRQEPTPMWSETSVASLRGRGVVIMDVVYLVAVYVIVCSGSDVLSIRICVSLFGWWTMLKVAVCNEHEAKHVPLSKGHTRYFQCFSPDLILKVPRPLVAFGWMLQNPHWVEHVEESFVCNRSVPC